MNVEPQVRVLEQVGIRTPVGVRFWDPVLNTQIRDGLEIEAWPASGVGKRTRAFRTNSDIYALRNLPGLRDLERLPLNEPASPPETRTFTIEVNDRDRRYLSVAFQAELPVQNGGLLPTSTPTSPDGGTAPGFLLFSAPSRRLPTWIGVLRGELADVNTRLAIGHALVRVELPGPRFWFGLADASGRFALALQFPAPVDFLASPPLTPRVGGLTDSTWEISLRVFLDPSAHELLAGASVPDYLRLLQQGPTEVWQVDPLLGGTPASEWTQSLSYGRELIVRSEGSSKLFISLQSSSP